MLICTTEDCDKPAMAKGFCRAHYLRVYRHGSTEPKRGGTMLQKFNKNCPRGLSEDDCWPWAGGHNLAGYGRLLNLDGVAIMAHRLSHELFIGPIPDGMMVMHSCDNPPCVNPKHLRWGTPKENMQDMIQKGRRVNGGAKGEAHYRSKLTEDYVRAIRLNPPKNIIAEAERMGVDENSIRYALKGKTWKHVK